jgi:hypothetical protein
VIRIGNEPKVPASNIFASQREDNKERISNIVQIVLAFSAVVVVLASLFRSRICQIRSVGSNGAINEVDRLVYCHGGRNRAF